MYVADSVGVNNLIGLLDMNPGVTFLALAIDRDRLAAKQATCLPAGTLQRLHSHSVSMTQFVSLANLRGYEVLLNEGVDLFITEWKQYGNEIGLHDIALDSCYRYIVLHRDSLKNM